jgi:tetratricopeptide (TPR) repeat protein
MRSWLLILLLAGLAAQAQNSNAPAPPKSQAPDSASAPKSARNPNLTPPRSDRVDASSLGDDPGDSSSKATEIDLSPPPDDAKAHPQSADALTDEGTGDVGEFHPWDPHKAAKDVEVGDFYFKKKNYKAAEDRYREALLYKQNDAVATYRLAVCLEKMERTDEARTEYEGYLKILPFGPLAPDAKKALERLKSPAANAKPASSPAQ